ncbi:unnamed protein product [Phytophthora lilii]|uniref:Unnamed protein product n=1 Tax=Phytophthora lilii TaxID=2077276 RepID=A0A9W7CU78_9STRA|nr:unnamed protein product [Phytophthora lilii]
MIKTFTCSLQHLISSFICQALSYPVVSMGIAELVGFPIPFFALSTIPIFFLLLMVWFTVIVGRSTVHDMLKRPEEVATFGKFIAAQMLMPAIYPVYEVLFSIASNTYYEFPVILLLQLLLEGKDLEHREA